MNIEVLLYTYRGVFFFSIVRAGDAIYVRVGDHDLTQKFGSPGAQTLRVATTYIHHNHNSQVNDNWQSMNSNTNKSDRVARSYQKKS